MLTIIQFININMYLLIFIIDFISKAWKALISNDYQLHFHFAVSYARMHNYRITQYGLQEKIAIMI